MRLLVGPGFAVEDLLARERVDHVLTLISPDAEAPHTDTPRTVLRFNDIAEPRPGLIAPSEETVATILALGGAMESGSKLLIHCYAGVSRSTAAAYILACAARPIGEEVGLALHLRRICPEATPNPLMIALADQALARGGSMSRAIAGIGRGVEAFEGTAFDWPLD